MNDAKHQVVDRLKQANNILVTVRTNPSVDLLSACIGLALALDKLGKHSAAVFSGEVPSTMEFLKPQETIEPTPNSLRDFIIALDKSKADKLRYKVEDKVVRIFITPYKTSISQDDLEFSQGDFNVDVVVALGAHEQEELDQAITQHGRILHDAAVISINNTPNGNLGSVNWQEVSASSVSEMATSLVKDLGKDLLDEQIATALLTGVVAETGRFSNEKTTPQTMSIAADLLAAGANQQLVATELQADRPVTNQGTNDSARPAPVTEGGNVASEAAKQGDGTLEIEHIAPMPTPSEHPYPIPTPLPESPELPKISPRRNMLPSPEPHISDVHGVPLGENPFTQEYNDTGDMPSQGRSYLIDEPAVPANTPKSPAHPIEPSQVNPSDVLPVEPPAPLLSRDQPSMMPPAPIEAPKPDIAPQSPQVIQPTVPSTSPEAPALRAAGEEDKQTLEQIEESVHSPHLAQLHPNVDIARNQVLEALKQGPQPLEPLASLNANPLGEQLHPTVTSAPEPAGAADLAPPSIMVDEDGNMQQVGHPLAAPSVSEAPATQPLDMPLPSVTPPVSPMPPTNTPPATPNIPPAAPPPFPPNFMNPGTH